CQAINPRALASQTRPRAADRLAEIDVERARLAALEHSLGASDAGLAALSPGSPEYHLRLAAALDAHGEARAAGPPRPLARAARGGAALAGGAPAPWGLAGCVRWGRSSPRCSSQRSRWVARAASVIPPRRASSCSASTAPIRRPSISSCPRASCRTSHACDGT